MVPDHLQIRKYIGHERDSLPSWIRQFVAVDLINWFPEVNQPSIMGSDLPSLMTCVDPSNWNRGHYRRDVNHPPLVAVVPHTGMIGLECKCLPWIGSPF